MGIRSQVEADVGTGLEDLYIQNALDAGLNVS